MPAELALVVFAATACSSPDAPREACTGVAQAPLVNGASHETFLGLSPGQIRALARITAPDDGEAALCSGTFVRNDWVLTARHCLVIESPEVTLVAEDRTRSRLAVVESLPHPYEDVALLRVDGSSAAAAGLTPIPETRAGSDSPKTGDLVELAGHGTTETGSSHELRFLVEPIVAMAESSFVVGGFGANGACSGDSGGPALARDATGRAVVVGVLTSGSVSCVDEDRYVRLDDLEAWLTERLGPAPAPPRECGGVSVEGRCLYGASLFCAEGELVTEACAGTTTCGWDVERARYGCVEAAADPCDGLDSIGRCRDGVALRCNAGELQRESCDCGTTCRVDGRTGTPHCVP